MSLLDEIEGVHRKTLIVSGGCSICPRKRVDFVPATLNKGPVIWLGEAPGATEVEEQEGFVGSSGELLRRIAHKVQVPEPWSFSNTIHCRPPENATPKPKEVQCCLSQFVLDEIRGYPVVVLAGNVPLQAIFPKAQGTHFRGNVAWHPDFPGQRFYSIYHPAYILRRRDLEGEFERQLERLARIARGEPAPSWQLVQGAKALEALRGMMKSPLLSVDFETNRLETWTEGFHIKTLTVTADMKTVAGATKDDVHFEPMLRLLAEYVTHPGHSVVGSNVGFDLEVLERLYGVRVACQLLHDTGVAYYHAKQYKMPSLKELVSRELDGYRFLVHQPHLCRDNELLLRYNAEDVIHPLALLRKSAQLLKGKPKTQDLVARVLGPAELVLRRITTAGIYLRQDYRKKKITEYQEKRRVVVQAWKDEDPEFIPVEHESGNGLLKYLFKIRKLPVLAKTEKGAPQTDAAVIKQWIRDGHLVMKHLLSLREIDKVESTYLTAYDKHVWPDSRIRSSYPITWTDSGRSSSRSPNLQNIPRDPEIRDLFGVQTGHRLIESDLSQIEFRIMVCLARDENGIAGYMRGDDAHTMTARTITGQQKVTKEQRNLAKPVNFGCLYGANAYTVQQYALNEYGVLWTEEDSQKFVDVFMSTYPRIPEFHKLSRSRLTANRGWFESVLGHTFFYDGWDSKDNSHRDHIFRAALNAEAQGPAAQICFYIMVLASRLLEKRGFRDVKFVNTVHDSILIDVPNPAWVPDVVAIIDEAAAGAHQWVKSWFVVPLIMEHKQGESWGSLEDIK